ncbi:hypothetical protein L915_12519 [Phytophthora nicotianae]|nr:hypothetical protein L915_12519 [Phytophthora nicotianae]ETM41923.1 hypothetical protein L914_12348 [Phytophthora nicotianae]
MMELDGTRNVTEHISQWIAVILDEKKEIKIKICD